MPKLIEFSAPILTITCFLPLLGAFWIALFTKKEQEKLIKYGAFVISLVDFVISLPLVYYFDPSTHNFQFAERYSWIPSIGVTYLMGIDGISILLVMLTTLLSAIAVLCSFAAITERLKEYYVCLLLLETGMLGTFMALDFFLFYVFWEIMLVPMYFLIGVWGGGRKLYSAIKFFLYTLFGSVLMLLGILSLYFLHFQATGDLTFDIVKITYQLQISRDVQFWLFLAFFIGFAIKVPMFPFHTWLPDAHTDAPTAGSVILAGVLLKMGTYGFIRFNLPIFPEASKMLVPFMVLLSVIGIIYGALVAMAQQDIKRLVAYSSVSHLGFVMLGLFALNPQGIAGGLLQMINHGLSTGALFLIVGMVYERRHTRMISEYGGLSHQVPVFTVIFAITMFSSIGLPGLNGFVGEFLILIGAFQASWLYALFAVSGIVLGAAYMLWLFQRMMFGQITNPANRNLADCNLREVVYMVPILIFMFWIGLYPKPYLDMMGPTVEKLVERVNHPTYQAVAKKSQGTEQGRAGTVQRVAGKANPEGTPMRAKVNSPQLSGDPAAPLPQVSPASAGHGNGATGSTPEGRR
ncbi:MAG: NADH-quinone oxidoreductase subunit M [Nitrospinae bacterium]|nr:NADH-quinone oxidoreductase subunit M [Nitrospinota bacterium]